MKTRIVCYSLKLWFFTWVPTVIVPVYAELQPISDEVLERSSAQAVFVDLPLLNDFNIEGGGIELDLDIQTSIESIEWLDSDGVGDSGKFGSLVLKGVHVGSSQTPISAEQVKNTSPFLESELASIHGLIIEAAPKKGTLITINQIGEANGNGIDIIVNDIYTGRDLSLEGQRGIGLLVEDLSNFVQDDTVRKVNQNFDLNLSSIDDGMSTQNGNYYPIKMAIQPLKSEVTGVPVGGSVNSDLLSEIEVGLSSISLTGSSMRIDAQFLLYVDKIAIYREGWEAGIKGLLIYQGLDSNGDGKEDLIGPVQVSDFKMQTVSHTLEDGSSVQAMHFPNIDINMDIAMESIYIGNPDTGSLGAIHIDNLHIHDTKMWIYPH